MSGRDLIESHPAALSDIEKAPASLTPSLLSGGVVVAELVGLAHEGSTALIANVLGAGAGLMKARTVIALSGAQIGQQVVIGFEHGDPCLPIVMGVLRGSTCLPLSMPDAQVEVTADGTRFVVSASEQLTLRCGKASVTLTKAGKVLIEGTYVSSKSTGVNRLKGGSVQLN
jgi:hypothetical protein